MIILLYKNKYNGFVTSEFSIITETYSATLKLKGTIENKSNDKAKEVKITVEISSGSLKKDCYAIIENPEIGNTINFEETLYGATGITDPEKYKIKLKNIEVYKEKTNIDGNELLETLKNKLNE